MTNPLLDLRDIRKSYAETSVLAGISIRLESGETLAFGNSSMTNSVPQFASKKSMRSKPPQVPLIAKRLRLLLSLENVVTTVQKN